MAPSGDLESSDRETRPEHSDSHPPAGDTPSSAARLAARPPETATNPQRAEVRVCCALQPDDLQAVHVALERHFGHALRLDVVRDPAVIGGIWVRVGDTVIDGSLRGRLDALRHHLRAQCKIMVTSGLVDYRSEDLIP